MNCHVRWPALVGGMVLAIGLVATPTVDRAQAQVAVQIQGGGYYTPYGQGPYGNYGQGYDPGYYPTYVVPYGGRGAYGYSGYQNAPYRVGYGSYGYRSAPYYRSYGRSLYYQRSARPVYAPFGY